MKKYYLILYIIMCFTACFAADADSFSISGFVYDKTNGEGLIGANVYLENEPVGSSTNLSGYYVIPRLDAGNYKVVCEYMGYKTYLKNVKLYANKEFKLNINLLPDLIQTETIVISADSISTVERLYRKPISVVQLSAKQLQSVPQIAEADLLRSLQTLPGIMPMSDFSSALYVRGGTPDQNLHLLDGTDVYNPEHMFGLFSTFNTEAIKHIELSKGAFGAEYGGRLSSILDITNLDGNREEFEGSASISLLSTKTTLQMPLGNFGSISGSLRRTYFDKTIAKTMDDIPDYYFIDGNVKAFFDIDKSNKLTISAYGGQDVLDLVFNEKASANVGFKYDWGNQTTSMRWTKVFSPNLFSNFWITASKFRSKLDFKNFDIQEKNDITDFTVKGNLEYQHSNSLGVKFGFEQKNIKGVYYQSESEQTIDILQEPRHYVGYFQGAWKPFTDLEVKGGLRYNYFDTDTSFQHIEPRLSLKYRLTDKINLKAATGIYHQYLHRIPRFIAADIWTVSNKYQRASESRHMVVGYQQEMSEDYEFEAEAYYKTYENIYSFNQNVGADIYTDVFDGQGNPIYKRTDGVFNRGDGRSWGFEASLRKDTGRMTGWIGYSFSKTQYKTDGINGGRYFAPRHDRTSTLNAVTNINLSKIPRKWVLGLNFVYSTGQPFTEPGSGYIIGSDPSAPYRYVEYAPTKINNIRFPDYARIDISLSYYKKFKSWSISPYLQVYNAGNRKNVWFANYEYENGRPSVKEQYMLPMLPTLGVNINF